MTRSGMSSTMAKVADGMRAGRGGTRMEVSGGVRRFTVGIGGNYVEDEFAPWISRRIGGRGAAAKLCGIVTNSGIEGNYSLAPRYWHPNWSNAGWLEYAKRTLLGKSVLDLPALTSQWKPELRRLGQLSYASAIEHC